MQAVGQIRPYTPFTFPPNIYDHAVSQSFTVAHLRSTTFFEPFDYRLMLVGLPSSHMLASDTVHTGMHDVGMM